MTGLRSTEAVAVARAWPLKARPKIIRWSRKATPLTIIVPLSLGLPALLLQQEFVA